MATLPLKTKLHIPPVRPELVPRLGLTERVNGRLRRKLTVVHLHLWAGITTIGYLVASLRLSNQPVKVTP